MGIGDACLRGPVRFGADVEAAHPADLVGADPLRRPAMRFGPRFVPSASTPTSMAAMFCGASRPDIGELVGKPDPLIYFPQEIGHLDQRIHLHDYGRSILACLREQNLFRPGSFVLRINYSQFPFSLSAKHSLLVVRSPLLIVD